MDATGASGRHIFPIGGADVGPLYYNIQGAGCLFVTDDSSTGWGQFFGTGAEIQVEAFAPVKLVHPGASR